MNAATVLLVEDDRDIRDLIDETLRRADITIHGVVSGEAALAHLEVHPVDLVILDIVLPGMDGWELLGAIREQPELAEIPVLVVSVLDTGARTPAPNVSYLAKPFRPAELTRVVQHLLDRPAEGHP